MELWRWGLTTAFSWLYWTWWKRHFLRNRVLKTWSLRPQERKKVVSSTERRLLHGDTVSARKEILQVAFA